jgi:hypothetical protein
VRGGKGYCTALSRNKKVPGAFSLHRDLPGGGVYDCTTYGAWGQTSWFLPVNSLFSPHKMSKTAASAVPPLHPPLPYTAVLIWRGGGSWNRILSHKITKQTFRTLFFEKLYKVLKYFQGFFSDAEVKKQHLLFFKI